MFFVDRDAIHAKQRAHNCYARRAVKHVSLFLLFIAPEGARLLTIVSKS